MRTNENALWSLGVHDLSVILYLLDEEPEEASRTAATSYAEGVEDVVFCYLRFPSGKIAHMHLSWLDPHKMRRMTVVGREKMAVFDDMELERKVTIYEKAPWKRAETYGEWQTRSGDIYIPKIPTDEPLRLECQHFLRARRRRGRPRQGRARRRDGRARARAAHGLAPWLRSTPTAIVYPGTVLGEGVKVLEDAVVGKQPSLSPRSTAKREPLPPTEIGDGTIVSTGAIVFAGSRLGERVIVGDQACVRERVDDRRRRRDRPRLARRERHDDRRDDEDPGRAPTSPPTRRSRSTSSSRPASSRRTTTSWAAPRSGTS